MPLYSYILAGSIGTSWLYIIKVLTPNQRWEDHFYSRHYAILQWLLRSSYPSCYSQEICVIENSALSACWRIDDSLFYKRSFMKKKVKDIRHPGRQLSFFTFRRPATGTVAKKCATGYPCRWLQVVLNKDFHDRWAVIGFPCWNQAYIGVSAVADRTNVISGFPGRRTKLGIEFIPTGSGRDNYPLSFESLPAVPIQPKTTRSDKDRSCATGQWVDSPFCRR